MAKLFVMDIWTAVGFVSQFLFFFSFVLQWYSSEKKKKSHIPMEFWYLRILGSALLLIYALARKDLVFLVTAILQVFIYIRNINLMRKDAEKVISVTGQ